VQGWDEDLFDVCSGVDEEGLGGSGREGESVHAVLDREIRSGCHSSRVYDDCTGWRSRSCPGRYNG